MMMPYALLRAEVYFGEVINTGVYDLSVEGFSCCVERSFREENTINHADPKKAELPPAPAAVRLYFYQPEKDTQEELWVRDFSFRWEEEPFRYCCRFEVKDASFAGFARRVIGAYTNYVALKEAGDDAGLSEVLTGYPAEAENRYLIDPKTGEPADFSAVREMWFSEAEQRGVSEDETGDLCEARDLYETWDFHETCDPAPEEFALSLDHPEKWEAYLAMPFNQFCDWFYKRHGLKDHPINKLRANMIYIGNSYCSFLFPDRERLFGILEKAFGEGLKPVLVFAPVREGEMDRVIEIIQSVIDREIEIVVNDWGLLRRLSEYIGSAGKHDQVKLTMGNLLCKRRKDVRFSFRAAGMEALEENAMDADFFSDWLRDTFHVSAYSGETCGYRTKFRPDMILHFPFYQMNTAGHCTLAAACRYGDRGKQIPMDSCPGYCKEQVFLYPEFLKMIGRYNSLFGYDANVMRDGRILREYLAGGIRRIVLEVL